MTRTLLILLMAWPLLLPPGLCTCRLPAFLSPAAPPAVTPSPKPSCPCCRKPAASETARPVQVEDQPDRSSPHRPHPPTCPAHPCWEVARAALTSERPVEAAPVLADVPADPASLPRPAVWPQPPRSPFPPHVPRHVLDCQLRC